MADMVETAADRLRRMLASLSDENQQSEAPCLVDKYYDLKSKIEMAGAKEAVTYEGQVHQEAKLAGLNDTLVEVEKQLQRERGDFLGDVTEEPLDPPESGSKSAEAGGVS